MENRPNDENEYDLGATKLKYILISKLNVDPAYQRGVKRKYKNIAKNYDQIVLGRLLVGERSDGSLWVVDGLQRLSSLKDMKKSFAPCEVFVSKGQAHEAEIFTKAGNHKTRSNLTAADRYRAALAANDPIVMTVEKVARENGFEVSLNGARGEDTKLKRLSCISTLVGAVESDPTGNALDFTLSTIKESWPADPQRNTLLIIGSLVKFYNLYNETGVPQTSGPFNKERLVLRLQDTSPVAIFQEARSGVTMHFSGDQFTKGCAVIERIYRKRKYGT